MLFGSKAFRLRLNGLGSLPGTGPFGDTEPESGESSRGKLGNNWSELPKKFAGKRAAFETDKLIIRKARNFMTESEILNG